jgi:predicted dehydrogenase
MAQKVIHVGVGSFGKRWCREFLRSNIDDGTIEVVAVVDIDPAALAYARGVLGLPEHACFTDPRRAFSTVKADFCTVVVPPNFHEQIVDLAIEHGLDVLSEKPIADTMAGSCASPRKLPRRAGRWR